MGGKDNFAADREAMRAVLAEMPSLAEATRLIRRFQDDAVRRLVARGVRQFPDIGAGLPVAGAVHETAQRLAPEPRVVHVDNDPLVLVHATALLSSSPEGACAFVNADLREPGKILARAAETLSFGQPVAVVTLMILHFIADGDDPWGIVLVRCRAYAPTGTSWSGMPGRTSPPAPLPRPPRGTTSHHQFPFLSAPKGRSHGLRRSPAGDAPAPGWRPWPAGGPAKGRGPPDADAHVGPNRTNSWVPRAAGRPGRAGSPALSGTRLGTGHPCHLRGCVPDSSSTPLPAPLSRPTITARLRGSPAWLLA